MDANDVITDIIAGLALAATVFFAIRQERINKRLKKVELRESEAFSLVKQAGKIITHIEVTLPDAFITIRSGQYREDKTKVDEFLKAARSFAVHTKDAELHLSDEMIAEFKKTVELVRNVDIKVSHFRDGFYPTQDENGLAQLNKSIFALQAGLKEFKAYLRAYSQQAN